MTDLSRQQTFNFSFSALQAIAHAIVLPVHTNVDRLPFVQDPAWYLPVILLFSTLSVLAIFYV